MNDYGGDIDWGENKDIPACPHCGSLCSSWFDRTIDEDCGLMLDRCPDCGKGIRCKYVGDLMDCDNCEERI